MPNDPRYGGRGNGHPAPRKPDGPAGISARELQALSARVTELEKQLQEKNTWSSLIQGWMGKLLLLKLIDGSGETGTLLAADRYTITIDCEYGGQTVIHKAAIISVRLSVSATAKS